MSESIYAPPKADVDVPLQDEHEYYVVSPKKFYLLSVLTLNLYFVYWSYRNWRLIKSRDKSDIWPVPRGIFLIFFTHGLLTDVNEAIKTKGQQFDWNPATTATLFVLLVILSNVLDRMAFREIGSPVTDMMSTGLAFVTPLLLLKAQRAINFVCGDPDGVSNSRFTLANWIWMIIGGLFWVLAIFGIYLILFEPDWLLE